MFVDACAIVSMIAGKSTADAYAAALAQSNAPWTSALSAWEAIVVLARPDQLNRGFRAVEDFVVEWLSERDIELRNSPPARDILGLAIDVAERHGIGKRGLSNFDCFHYAYAKSSGDPLLTLDARLRETDVVTKP